MIKTFVAQLLRLSRLPQQTRALSAKLGRTLYSNGNRFDNAFARARAAATARPEVAKSGLSKQLEAKQTMRSLKEERSRKTLARRLHRFALKAKPHLRLSLLFGFGLVGKHSKEKVCPSFARASQSHSLLGEL